MKKQPRFFRITVWVLGSVFILVISTFAVLDILLSPVNSKNDAGIAVVVPKGSGVSAIGKILEEKNLVRSSLLFRYAVWRERLAGKIQAGTFKLRQDMSTVEIASAMTKGTSDTWITIPEGWRNEEVAEAYAAALTDTFNADEFLAAVKGKQGHLFPDTYLFPKEASASTVIRVMTQTLDRKVTGQMLEDLKVQRRTLDEVLTLASLIQREAKHPEDMKVVSGILMNRLKLGWALQVDATLQYIKGYDAQEETWWGVPTGYDKSIRSAYNTYLNSGLPPGPIANPGLDAITAAIYPTETDYFFYITGNDGQMHYAKTVEEHNENIQNYLR